MSLPTYADLAKIYGVILCGPRDERNCIDPVIGYDHWNGYGNASTGVVHFTDRRPTKRGIRNFLMLVADISLSHNRGQPRWLRVYGRNIWASREARMLRMRFPVAWSEKDRLLVRYYRKPKEADGHIYDWCMKEID